jgi:hypothetical protein
MSNSRHYSGFDFSDTTGSPNVTLFEPVKDAAECRLVCVAREPHASVRRASGTPCTSHDSAQPARTRIAGRVRRAGEIRSRSRELVYGIAGAPGSARASSSSAAGATIATVPACPDLARAGRSSETPGSSSSAFPSLTTGSTVPTVTRLEIAVLELRG